MAIAAVAVLAAGVAAGFSLAAIAVNPEGEELDRVAVEVAGDGSWDGLAFTRPLSIVADAIRPSLRDGVGVSRERGRHRPHLATEGHLLAHEQGRAALGAALAAPSRASLSPRSFRRHSQSRLLNWQ
jgi:hypothetical protein